MRILHVITSLRTGGAEKLMVDLLPRLRDSGHDVDLMLFDGTQTPFRSVLEETGINIISYSGGKNVYNPINAIRLRRLMSNYDIVHTHNYAPQLFAAIVKPAKGVKLITTEHGGSNRRRKFKWYATIDRWMYNQYDKIICIATKTQTNLNVFVGRKLTNAVVINNGVDVARYADASPSPELEAIAPGSRKIIMVAGFRWEKDQDTLIKSLMYLPENFHLFLVGDGTRRSELENLAGKEGVIDQVHFLGLRTDVPNLLHAADYVVMSSHFEGLSLSSVEGMSVGKPFLASDVDGLREVVKGAGILFPHQDAKMLAGEIEKLEDSPEFYKLIANACFKRARLFDISAMTSSYTELYNNI